MKNATTKPAELPARPAKPGPPTEPKTLVAKIESSLRHIEHATDAIYQTAQDLAKSQPNLHRHARRFQSALGIARRDLAELRARIAHQNPEFPAPNHTAAPSSSTIRPKLHSNPTVDDAIAHLYGPPTSPPDEFPELRAK